MLDLDQTIDLFYDVYYKSLKKLFYLYNKFNKPSSFDLFLESSKYILEGKVSSSFSKEDNKELEDIFKPIYDHSFSKEYIRKAMQLLFLKMASDLGFNKSIITPDTIGSIATFLIEKLTFNKSNLRILDPFLGTGNYLYTIYNNLGKNVSLFGVDNNYEVLRYAKNLADLLEIPIELIYKDAIDLYNTFFDIITFDSDSNIDIYTYILKLLDMLYDDGYLIALVDNDFFSYDTNLDFKESLKLKGIRIIGVVELPSSFFLNNLKSFIIFSKVKTKDNNVLLSKLPNINDKDKFLEEINRIDTWIKINIVLKDEDILEDLL